MTDLIVHAYGDAGATVIVLHGGPAAAGDVAPLARALGRQWRALEPFQRAGGDRPLTVETHVRDLHDLIETRCQGAKPALVGHSWGAMLALAYAAAHPGSVAALVLIGCGTFSARSRQEFHARVDARLTPVQRAELERIKAAKDDVGRVASIEWILNNAYGYDVDDDATKPIVVDARAHDETWADMMRLQAEGVYPAAFSAIDVPVLMLHGEEDPHPGAMIHRELQAHVPQLEYRELPECGHSPWLERRASATFYARLHEWLRAQLVTNATKTN